MIASDDPWVRQPVVSPGAWKRSASIRTQRCSISAEIGYSAWSMKLRCRFSAMIRCASGSIQVVTNVARLRCGSPSRFRSSASSRMASVGRIPVAGNDVDGAASVRNRLPKSASASLSLSVVMAWLNHRSCRSGCVECLDDPARRETDRAGERPPVDEADVDRAGGRRAREGGDAGEEEEDGAELVDRHHPPAQTWARTRTWPAPTSSMARCPETRKQTQPRMSGSQIQPLDCRGVSPWAKAATRLTANKQGPDEEHDRAAPAAASRREPHQRSRSGAGGSGSPEPLTASRTEA